MDKNVNNPLSIEKIHAGHADYSVIYDPVTHEFEFRFSACGKILISRIEGVYEKDGQLFSLPGNYKKCETNREIKTDSVTLSVNYAEYGDKAGFQLKFNISDDGIQTEVFRRGDLDVRFSGEIYWGEDSSCVTIDRETQNLRGGMGPASSKLSNAVFNTLTDSALCFLGGMDLRIKYNWDKKGYTYRLHTGSYDYSKSFSIFVKKDVCGKLYNIDYKPINKNTVFKEPYSGWMTWYAVRFDACEEIVLKNAKWQAENLKDFGATAIWVDWEWYHKDFEGERDDGTDTFNPDLEKYPNGLKYLADKIRELGLIPSLWVGFTNDPAENEYIKKYPEMVLVDSVTWCGKYFLDMSHPKFLEEYLPAAFGQLSEWGYEALKWDCIPATLNIHNEHHEKMYDTSLTVKAAYRNMVKIAKEIMGEDFFMMSCSSEKNADILWGADLFTSARIGGDIFEWSEFITQCVERVVEFYPLNNTVLYLDPDNLVLREKFNTYNQAVSRASFVSLLGMPLTLGDELYDLPPDRVEILKRVLPPINTRPMDIGNISKSSKIIKTNLFVEKPFESFNVVNILNLAEEAMHTEVYIDNDLNLDDGEYLVYDFWNRKFLGIYGEKFGLDLEAYSTKTLAVRKLLGRPQLLTSLRHITQGAIDIENMEWDEASSTISGASRVVAKDKYELIFYAPDGYESDEDNTLTLSHMPEETGLWNWSITFKRI